MKSDKAKSALYAAIWSRTVDICISWKSSNLLIAYQKEMVVFASSLHLPFLLLLLHLLHLEIHPCSISKETWWYKKRYCSTWWNFLVSSFSYINSSFPSSLPSGLWCIWHEEAFGMLYYLQGWRSSRQLRD